MISDRGHMGAICRKFGVTFVAALILVAPFSASALDKYEQEAFESGVQYRNELSLTPEEEKQLADEWNQVLRGILTQEQLQGVSRIYERVKSGELTQEQARLEEARLINSSINEGDMIRYIKSHPELVLLNKILNDSSVRDELHEIERKADEERSNNLDGIIGVGLAGVLAAFLFDLVESFISRKRRKG